MSRVRQKKQIQLLKKEFQCYGNAEWHPILMYSQSIHRYQLAAKWNNFFPALNHIHY